MTTYSLAAVTYRNLEATRRFIESVYENTSEDFEFIMVSNNATADVLDYLRYCANTKPNFLLLEYSENTGIGVAMNSAMRRCHGDVILRCDSDIVIQTRGWMKLLAEKAEMFPEVGAVGTHLANTKPITTPGKYTEVQWIPSCCMLIHRRALNAIRAKIWKNEFDIVSRVIPFLRSPEKYPEHHKHLEATKQWAMKADGCWDAGFRYSMDDMDYSYTVMWAGLKLIRDERVKVFHLDDSMRKGNEARREADVGEAAQYLRTKWEIVEDHWNDPEAPGGKGWWGLPWNLPKWREYEERYKKGGDR